MERYTLSQWRRLRGYSQEELAHKVDLTAKTIANYEKSNLNFCNASYNTVQKLANVLGITLSQFLLDSTSEKQK
ncbi:MAG: helix-turn-helix transcriptional regulator [Aerococcus sp.]|nr:helix-turn-helix transcriptional regulator [Aerococcus sp.]